LDNNPPKIIWLLWLQGLADAPLVVRKCYDSWLKHNPGWQFNFLDADNIADHIDLKQAAITNQSFSDILRINLLAKYGGVWVDATCFCTTPLDEWLPRYIKTGFFAFDRPGPDRMISSWFLASNKYNYITLTYKTKVNAYWSENPGLISFESSRWHFLNKRLQRRSNQVWFSTFVYGLLKVYPYFWFHYLFENIYLNDKQFKEMWDDTPKCSADIPHKLQISGLFDPLSKEIKDEIDQKVSPVYKLTWKYESSEYKEDSVLAYLLNK
jgi:Capsular polysaccharide synthesis protein